MNTQECRLLWTDFGQINYSLAFTYFLIFFLFITFILSVVAICMPWVWRQRSVLSTMWVLKIQLRLQGSVASTLHPPHLTNVSREWFCQKTHCSCGFNFFWLIILTLIVKIFKSIYTFQMVWVTKCIQLFLGRLVYDYAVLLYHCVPHSMCLTHAQQRESDNASVHLCRSVNKQPHISSLLSSVLPFLSMV